MRIEIIAGRGKNYIAEITGTHPVYKYERRFLSTVETGFRRNCYTGLRTVENLPVGALVEINTGNHKAAQTREFYRITEDGKIKITESDLMDSILTPAEA